MHDAATVAALPVWLVVGMWARAWLDDLFDQHAARSDRRKRARGAG